VGGVTSFNLLTTGKDRCLKYLLVEAGIIMCKFLALNSKYLLVEAGIYEYQLVFKYL